MTQNKMGISNFVFGEAKRAFRTIGMGAMLFAAALVHADKRPTQTLVYDKLTLNLYREMSDGSLEKIKGVPSVMASKPFQVKVINVNSLKYSVEIKVEEEESFKSVPPGLDALFPAISPLSLGSKLLSGMGSKQSEGTKDLAAANFESQIDQINTDLTKLEMCLGCYGQLIAVQDKIMDVAMSMPDPVRAPEQSTADPREPGRASLKELRSAVEAAVSGHIQTLIKNNIVMGAPSPQPLNLKDINLPALAGNLVGKLDKSYQDLTADLVLFNEAYEDYKTSLGEASVKAVADSKALEAVQLAGVNRALDNKQKEVEKRLEDVGKVVDDFKKNERANQKQIMASARLVQRVMNEDVFQVEGQPATPKGDTLRLKIKFAPISDKSDNDKGLLASTEGTFVLVQESPQVDVDVKVVGKTKVDFSAGVFFANLTDGNYRIQQNGGSNYIVKGPSDSFNFSYGALAHIYKTSTSRITPALSFGVGTSSGSPSFFLGPSLLIGDQQRFVFTLGIAARTVKRLDGVSEGKYNGTDVPTTNVMRSGVFFSVTFNIGRN